MQLTDALRAARRFNAPGPTLSYAFYLFESRGHLVEEGFKLGVSPIEVLSVPQDRLENQMRGWIRPEKGAKAFLKSLSENGATHHSFMIYDGNVDMLKFFGKLIGVPVVEL